MVDISKLDEVEMPNLEDAISLYNKEARFCQPTPEDSHLSLIYKLRELYPDSCNYLEIGTLFGFSMVNATRSKTKGKFVGIDLFETTGVISMNDYTSDVTDRNLSFEKTSRLVESCNVNNHDFNLILGNSLAEDTFNKATEICNEYDVMFIDGDHSRDGVVNDFERYFPLLKKGGFMLFDDQDYPDITAAIRIIKYRHGPSLEWIPHYDYIPKFSGFFRKL
jgi:predicted O-methyltransferase YrrM